MASFHNINSMSKKKLPANHGLPYSHLHVLEAGTKASLPEACCLKRMMYKNACWARKWRIWFCEDLTLITPTFLGNLKRDSAFRWVPRMLHAAGTAGFHRSLSHQPRGFLLTAKNQRIQLQCKMDTWWDDGRPSNHIWKWRIWKEASTNFWGSYGNNQCFSGCICFHKSLRTSETAKTKVTHTCHVKRRVCVFRFPPCFPSTKYDPRHQQNNNGNEGFARQKTKLMVTAMRRGIWPRCSKSTSARAFAKSYSLKLTKTPLK